MRYEYLLTGDALDVFITSKLETEQLKESTEELYETVEMGADGDAESKLQKMWMARVPRIYTSEV